MKPANASRRSGLLAAHIARGQEYGAGRSPHYEILVDADSQYRIAVNVRSADGSDVLAFGAFFQDPGRDRSFGFSPEKGVQDIHMVQGSEEASPTITGCGATGRCSCAPETGGSRRGSCDLPANRSDPSTGGPVAA